MKWGFGVEFVEPFAWSFVSGLNFLYVENVVSGCILHVCFGSGR